MEIFESPKFAKLADDYLSDEELHELKLFLAINPDVGVVIPGSGECRKLRLQEWEQGRCKPTGVALKLLMIARRHP